MGRIHHLRELVDNIKKTEKMISLHKDHGEIQLMVTQYEDLKGRQVAELIDELAKSPFTSTDSFSVIKLIIERYYPFIDADHFEQKELKELASII